MTNAIIERRVLGSIIVSIFLSFIYLSIKEVQGSHVISLMFTAILIGTVMLEYLKPWYGFYLFLLFWPSMWIIGELLAKQGNPYWNVLPWDWPAPLTTAISLGCWLRFRRAPITYSSNAEPLTIAANKPPKWFHGFRLALWGLLLSYIFSYATATWRLQQFPADWIVPSGAKSTPFTSTLTYLPAIILGLLLLNRLGEIFNHHSFQSANRTGNNNEYSIPHIKMIVFAIIGGIIAAIVFLYQRQTGFTWAFNSGDPLAGPFSNKNTTAPYLAATGMLSIALAHLLKLKWKRLLFYLIGIVFLYLTFLTQSRNGVLMVFSMGIGSLLVRAEWRRIALALSFLVLSFIFLLWVPVPKSDMLSITSLSRLIDTIEQFRAGGLNAALGERWLLFKASFLIFRDYPLFGSGIGTFPMLTAEGARFGSVVQGYHMPSAHSMPLNLLAENGLLGMLSWSTAWIIIPLIGITRCWHSGNVFALTIFVIGLGNIFDTVWMVPGMTTLCVLLIIWACAEEQLNNLSRMVKNACSYPLPSDKNIFCGE